MQDMKTYALLVANFLKLHNVVADIYNLQNTYFQDEKLDFCVGCVRALKSIGFKARKVKVNQKRIPYMPLPCFIEIEQNYYLALKADDKGMLYADGNGNTQAILYEDIVKIPSYTAIFAVPRDVLKAAKRTFDISWFIPVIVKYKALFRDVLLASFFVQMFALITPLFFQVVIDKVLVHAALSTLYVIVIGLIFIYIFEALLNFLRDYVLIHTTSRVDVELGAKLYQHMLGLHLNYFTSRPVGQTVARVQELDSIREFLTGNALTVVMDVLFTFIFIAVMFIYSPFLTMVVLLSLPFYFVLSLVITPMLRRRVEELFQRGARTQSFLVESTSGMETLKSMAVESQMRVQWERQLSAYVKSGFKMRKLSLVGSNSVQFINKVTSTVLLFFGAKLVISGDLNVGELIAFNMLAGQVNAPIIRLAQLWQDFQQFRISLDRLGDILNTTGENTNEDIKESLLPIKGHVRLEGVSFRYDANGREILKNITLDIPAGKTVGFVGRSGSGKSTLTQLVQRLYTPQHGKIYIDGNDITLMNTSWLRSQIGVVLQENYLFNRSIRDNIALAKPTAPLSEVTKVAELAGAHPFISELSHGYDTLLEERGSNLSGGQRQRIAIARALLTDPSILILDEATSALDYESEKCIQDNMKFICQGRTVIIVAHRLSTVRDADMICVLDNGGIMETGSHANLIEKQGLYANLHAQQVR